MKKQAKQPKTSPETSPEPETNLPDTVAAPQFTITFLQDEGVAPFLKWFNQLRDRTAKQRISARLTAVEQGKLGHTEVVGEGVSEFKIDYGPGYRVYYGRKGDVLVVIVCGGDKSSQAADIKRAKELWKKHKDETENV